MESLQEKIAALPKTPGVYIYRNTDGQVIYVGKAVNLSRRVKQYFQRDDAVGDKTRHLVSEITDLETIGTTSEFDALLLEAKLIRSYMPKFNVISRDDKSPLYVAFTLSEELPHIVLLRKGEVAKMPPDRQNAVYGPFQSAHALRTLLRQVRAAVPYCTQKHRTGKPCFYTHLGLCAPCPSEIVGLSDDARRKAVAAYRKNIFRLKAIFDGKANSVKKEYEKAMRDAAAALRFEEAAEFKKRLDTLYQISEHRYDPAVFLERGAEDVYHEELSELRSSLSRALPGLSDLSRIECFDMSQLFGTSAVGSMVVLENGRPDPTQYRRFRIRTNGTISDTGMMHEVLTRRCKHPEWPTPSFILIDGGKPQLSVAKDIIPQLLPGVPYAGLAKRREEIIIPQGASYRVLRLPLSGKAIKVLQRVRDEAHRFAISFHRLLREKRTVPV